MPMDETTIKTNLGLILQAILARAIENAGFTAIQNFQYEATCEKPDFLIPNAKKPRFMVEVHQTDTRDSFRMKTLRTFTAVTESKAFYGDDLVSVNVLFGDPDNELPASNVRALCGGFDVNLIPRKDAADRKAVVKLEQMALALASDEEFKNKTVQAANEVIAQHVDALTSIAAMMKDALGKAQARTELFPMWQAERIRTANCGKAPRAGFPSYFKRGLLGSLFLSDADWAELLKATDPNHCSVGLRNQLVATQLATVEELTDGDEYTLDPQFRTFLEHPRAAEWRELCEAELDVSTDLCGFFEDIRDQTRRVAMVSGFFKALAAGKQTIVDIISAGLKGDAVCGIEHSRCWPADLLALLVNHSQNDFNRRMVQSGRDPENYQYPFNHISGRFERLLGCPEHFGSYAEYAVDVFSEICAEDHIDDKYIESAQSWLPDAILNLRLDGAMKLQKFNPLYACLIEMCGAFGLVVTPERIKSITFDLAGGKGRLGKYDAMTIQRDGKIVLTLAVSVHDRNGDHKSKEWGARRLATLYRMQTGKVQQSAYADGLFILDGEWEDKDIARLHRSGWNHICRLGELDATLQKIFGLKGKALVKKAKSAPPVFAVDHGDGDI